MRFSLIGMSGSGKSYWSKKLGEKGFKRFGCDDLIEEQLGDELKVLGYLGTQDVAKWMGQPFDPQYLYTSKKYLEYEQKVVNQILAVLEQSKLEENIIIDTTGSVIYLADDILNKLTALTKVIYLNTPESVQQKMYNLYLKDPKPVIWGESFVKTCKESNMEALGRCYSKLLATRTKKYQQLADITMDYDLLHSADFTEENFLNLILK